MFHCSYFVLKQGKSLQFQTTEHKNGIYLSVNRTLTRDILFKTGIFDLPGDFLSTSAYDNRSFSPQSRYSSFAWLHR